MKKKGYLLLLIPVAWLLLSEVLWRMEAQSPDASILSLGDALWYSLVTLTTVGYGDSYPVTLGGKVIGVLFILLSTGFMAFLVCLVISTVTGKMLPIARLVMHRKMEWYIFTDCSDGSKALMKDILCHHPKAVLILTVPEEGEHLRGVVCIESSVQRLLKIKGGSEGCCVFCLSEEQQENYRKANEITDLGVDVYCHSGYAPDRIKEKLHLYDRNDGCARLYWSRYPLSFQERHVVLIGFEKIGQQLLERGLLINQRDSKMPVTYHVFGESRQFCNNHPALSQTVSLGAQAEDRDGVIFYQEDWNENHLLIEEADRIVICPDADDVSMEILKQLRRYFPVNGKVHIHLPYTLEGECTFGGSDDLFTEELVIRDRLNRMAMILHGIYSSNYPGADAWDALSEFKRQSNIAAADHLLTKIRILLQDDTIREITVDNAAKAYACFEKIEDKSSYQKLEHERWMRFHYMYNWQYAEKRCDSVRKHPLLVPFEMLSVEEQQKDNYPWQIMGEIAKNLRW